MSEMKMLPILWLIVAGITMGYSAGRYVEHGAVVEARTNADDMRYAAMVFQQKWNECKKVQP